MAQFCTKCGAPLAEGLRFCTACGAALAGPPAPAQPPMAQAAAPPTPPSAAPATPAPVGAAPVPAAPATTSGSPVLKIILVVVAILLFFSLLGAGACVYFVYRTRQRVHQFERHAQMTFPMPTGTQPAVGGQAPTQESATSIDPATLIYPGATAKEGASLAVGGFQVQQYVTDDSVDKVVSFYKDKLGPKALVQETNNQTLVQVGGPNGLFTVTITHDTASGKTQFSIMRIGK